MKTILLLGAGAMIPFGGPSTKELTELITHDIFTYSALQILKNRYGNGVNFETLLSNLETLLEWKLSDEYYKDVITSSVFLNPISNLEMTSARKLQEIHYNAINKIIERVSTYSELKRLDENDCKIIRDLSDYLLGVADNSNTKVYSLNYDRLIPKLLKDKISLYDGTNNSYFEYDIEKYVNHNFTYFNLHGSIYMEYIHGGRVHLSETPVDYTHRYSIPGGNYGEIKAFIPIIAGYSKTQRILSEPFNFGIGVFMYDCNTCDKLFIIGYSFADLYINNVIKNLVTIKKVEIVIIDYREDYSFPSNIPYNDAGIRPQDFKVFRSGIFFNSKQNVHLYVRGFQNYIIESIL